MQKEKYLVIITAIIGGLLLNFFNIPAGAMVGSLLGTVVAQLIIKNKIEVPTPIKCGVQVLMGCYIGLGITYDTIMGLSNILVAITFVIFGISIMTLLLTYLLHRFCDWDLAESYLSSLPAGASEIVMIAEEYNVNVIKVATIQMMRLIIIVIGIPLLIKLVFI